MKKRKIVSSAVVGNIVEYYDFGIYAVYASMIGGLFFPPADDFIQTLAALAVFAIGFLMRPIGGIVFGHIGDRYGRKVALTSSIIGMAICTLLIGSLPTYESIGAAAPVLLLLVRMIQGICIGGEGAGSAIFVLEHLEGYKQGLIGSIVMASNMLGTLLANFAGIIIYHFLGESDMSWRIGFWIGAVMGTVGLYMRTHVKETPQFEEAKRNNQTKKLPLATAMKEKWRRLLLIASLGGVTSAVAYMIRGYFNTFFVEILNYDHETTLYFTSFSLANMILMLPLFGLMADRVGYRKFLYAVCYAILLAVVPLFYMIANPAQNVLFVFVALFFYSTLAAAVCAPAYPYAVGAFSTELRYSGVAFSWNTGIAIFGGTTPAICRILSEKLEFSFAPALYIVVMCIAFILVSFLTRKDKH
jgi:MHS family proline/betaine transporter-like MFS transporter